MLFHLLMHSLMLLVCALTEDRTYNLGVLGRDSNQLTYPARDGCFSFLLTTCPRGRDSANLEDGRVWTRPSPELSVCPSPLRGVPSSRPHVFSPELLLGREWDSFPLESIAAFFTVLCRKQPGSTEPSIASGPAEARGMFTGLLCPPLSTFSPPPS